MAEAVPQLDVILAGLQAHTATVQIALTEGAPDGSLGYANRVAGKLLELVARELEMGRPGADDEQALLAAIARQQRPWTDAELLARLKAHALAKVAVDNPGYSTYHALTGTDARSRA